MLDLLLISLFLVILVCLFIYEKHKNNQVTLNKTFYIYIISFILCFIFRDSSFSVVWFSVFTISTNGLLKFFIRIYLEDPKNKKLPIFIGFLFLILLEVILTYNTLTDFTIFEKWVLNIPIIGIFSTFEVNSKNTKSLKWR